MCGGYIVALLIVLPAVVAAQHAAGNFTFHPPENELGNVWTGYTKFIRVNFPYCEENFTRYEVESEDTWVMTIANVTAADKDPTTGCLGVHIGARGEHLGRKKILVRVTYPSAADNPCDSEEERLGAYEIVVMRPPMVEQAIFRWGVTGFLVILNFGFGCSLNLDVVKEIVRRPFAPGVGFCCQYIMMPLIGLAVSKTLLGWDPLFGFGLICSSCSPGGAGSNVWCLLLGGDVNLSLTMTFFSLAASLAMMPFWLFVLSRLYIDPKQVQVPYLSILNNLAVFVIPCFVGVVVRKLRPAVGDRLGRMIKPLAVIFMAFLLTFGLYTNRYIYGFMGKFPSIIPPSILQPYMGFAFGFCIARFAARQPKYRAITIAIETGVQNVTIPMVMLQGSFPQPFGDIAAVMPVMTAHFTPIPLLGMWIALITYRRFFKQSDDQQTKDIEDEEAEPAKAKAIEASKDSKNGYLSAAPTANPRDSLLVKNGLTASALGRQFFAADQESVI